MKIYTFSLGQLQTNCYLIVEEKTKNTLIIDPADDANFITEQILELKLNPKAILATHGHFDHILAANELQLNFQIPFFINQKDQFLLEKMSQNASYWLKQKIVEIPPQKVFFFPENSNFTPSGFEITLLPTPGHTPGSTCFHFPKEKILFTGDTLFADGVGRTDFSYSSQSNLISSLQKLSLLPPETQIYPGHGLSTQLSKAIG